MTLTAAVHIAIGTPEVHAPLRLSEMAPMPASVLAVIWHYVSVQLSLFALALFYVAKHENKAMLMLLLASCLGFGLLFVGYGVVDFGNLWVLPQWIAFFGVSLLILWGMNRRTRILTAASA